MDGLKNQKKEREGREKILEERSTTAGPRGKANARTREADFQTIGDCRGKESIIS